MWKRIVIALALNAVKAIDWTAVLERVKARLTERTGVDLTALDAKTVLAVVEEVLAERLGIELDLNRDNVIGDGQEG